MRAFFCILSVCTAVNMVGGGVCYLWILSCLYGSERVRKGFTAPRRFLSCLYGSELKYYTFSPLLIKQNHPILLQHPFLSLPSSSTNYQQLTFTSKNRVFTVPPINKKSVTLTRLRTSPTYLTIRLMRCFRLVLVHSGIRKSAHFSLYPAQPSRPPSTSEPNSSSLASGFFRLSR